MINILISLNHLFDEPLNFFFVFLRALRGCNILY